MTPLSERIHAASNDDLVTMYRFFSSPLISRFYSGLLDDVREELQQRGVDVLESLTCECGHQHEGACPDCECKGFVRFAPQDDGGF